MSKAKSVVKQIRFDMVTAPLIQELALKTGRTFTSIATEATRDGLALEKWQTILKK
jgi:predicted transcriptional regulator